MPTSTTTKALVSLYNNTYKSGQVNDGLGYVCIHAESGLSIPRAVEYYKPLLGLPLYIRCHLILKETQH